MAVANVTNQNFDAETKEGLVLVDFWASWCGPCRMIAPVLEEISEELAGKAKVVKIDVEENSATAEKYEVMSIPALFVFKNGEVVDKMVGFQPKDAIVGILNSHL